MDLMRNWILSIDMVSEESLRALNLSMAFARLVAFALSSIARRLKAWAWSCAD